jgi:hypothetical protein
LGAAVLKGLFSYWAEGWKEENASKLPPKPDTTTDKGEPSSKDEKEDPNKVLSDIK